MNADHFKALDLLKEGKWHEAHVMIQNHTDRLSCLIHGYLHKKEGDLDNAQYWYNRAGENLPDNSLDEELARLYALTKSVDEQRK